MHCLVQKISVTPKIHQINKDGCVISLNVLVRTEKKKTNFLPFVDTYVTFQLIFTQCKGSKDANLMDFQWQGMFIASPKTVLQASLQFDFLIFTPHLYSRMDQTQSQITWRGKRSSGSGHCSLDSCMLDCI